MKSYKYRIEYAYMVGEKKHEEVFEEEFLSETAMQAYLDALNGERKWANATLVGVRNVSQRQAWRMMI